MLPRGAGDNSLVPPLRYLDVFMELLDTDADLGEEVRSGRLVAEVHDDVGKEARSARS
jgi:hypothetical protein